MNPTSAIVLAGGLVALGKWSKGQKLDMHFVISASFVAITLTVLAEINDKFARAMSVLILVAALYAYGPSIVTKAGLTK